MSGRYDIQVLRCQTFQQKVVVRVQKAAESSRLSMVHLNESKIFAIMHYRFVQWVS
jgi:hypothetical protein